jgi:hypothetical protein
MSESLTETKVSIPLAKTEEDTQQINKGKPEYNPGYVK